jgi:hypothetical protein
VMNYTAVPDVNSMVAVTVAANDEVSSGSKFRGENLDPGAQMNLP